MTEPRGTSTDSLGAGRSIALAALPLLVWLLQLPVARLGDDWIFFEHFRHLPLWSAGDAESAWSTNTSVSDGLRFRPFAYTHMWLEAKLGLGFAASHLIGVAYLIGAAQILARIVLALGAKPAAGFGAALVFVLHPAQCEVWGWATARIDGMATFFGLACLLCLLRDRRILAGLMCLAAFASKESSFPLLVAAPLIVALAPRQERVLRAGLRAGLPLLLAFIAYALLKLAYVGEVFAESWQRGIAEVPLGVRIKGYLSLFEPLLWTPSADYAVAELASPWKALARIAAWIFVALLLSAGLSTYLRRERPAWRLVMALLIAYALCIAVSFGVPFRPDFAGGRLWLLPSAFLFSALFFAAPLRLTMPAAGLATLLLHANLSVYRDACARMQHVETAVETAMRQDDSAIRIVDLPSHEGPVPLFAIMTVYHHESFGSGAIPRAFLTLRPANDEQRQQLAAYDEQWRTEMKKQGRSKFVRMRWDEASQSLRRD